MTASRGLDSEPERADELDARQVVLAAGICDRSLVISPALDPEVIADSATVESGESAARRPIAIDLFSGAGGLSLGFESAGFDVVSAVEYDPVHAATHLYNFPLTDVICADVTNVSKEQLLASAGRGWELHNPGVEWDGVIDAVIGGPSCQGFSTMGKQDADDERNQLVFEFVRIVCELKPRTFCMENVPGLLDPRFDKIRDRALGTLREAGYKISGDKLVLKAEDFGVPQKRRRVVILGVLEADEAPSAPTVTSSTPYTVADAFEGLPEMWRYRTMNDKDVLHLTDAAKARRAAANGDYVTLAGILGDGGDHFGHARVVDHDTLSGCRMTQHGAVAEARFAGTKQGTKEPISRFFRLSLTAPALTLRAGTGRERGAFSAARPLHPTAPRVVTVREAARLHSFPDWFRFHTTNWHAHRQIGNAVPPLLARAAAKALMEAMGETPSVSRRDAIEFGDELLISLSPTQAATRLEVSVDQVPKRKRPEAEAEAEAEAA